jgi:flotillin
MYGEGNSTKLVRDVMNSTDQVIEGVKQTTGLDLGTILAGFIGGKAAGKTPESDSTVSE